MLESSALFVPQLRDTLLQQDSGTGWEFVALL